MATTVDVVSIGTLSRNPFWGETQPVRASHATCTLVRDGAMAILVDPSLPGELLEQRLSERTGLKAAQVQAVFLTTWRPAHRRGLHVFDHAEWLMSEVEIAAMRRHLERLQVQTSGGSKGVSRGGQQARAGGADKGADRMIADELDMLGRCKPAPDKLTVSVHLFPLHGVSPGASGLLVAAPLATVIVAGDAVLTRDYLERGQAYEES